MIKEQENNKSELPLIPAKDVLKEAKDNPTYNDVYVKGITEDERGRSQFQLVVEREDGTYEDLAWPRIAPEAQDDILRYQEALEEAQKKD